MKFMERGFLTGSTSGGSHDVLSWSEGMSALFPKKTKLSFQSDIIEDFYELRDREEVYEIIEGNKFLILLLMEAHTEIRKRFPEAQKLYLETFYHDDEFATPTLSLFIKVSLTGEDARKRLRKFDEEWWLANVPRADGLLCIDVERI